MEFGQLSHQHPLAIVLLEPCFQPFCGPSGCIPLLVTKNGGFCTQYCHYYTYSPRNPWWIYPPHPLVNQGKKKLDQNLRPSFIAFSTCHRFRKDILLSSFPPSRLRCMSYCYIAVVLSRFCPTFAFYLTMDSRTTQLASLCPATLLQDRHTYTERRSHKVECGNSDANLLSSKYSHYICLLNPFWAKYSVSKIWLHTRIKLTFSSSRPKITCALIFPVKWITLSLCRHFPPRSPAHPRQFQKSYRRPTRPFILGNMNGLITWYSLVTFCVKKE